MAHDHDSPSKLEIATHAALPMVLMLFIEMALNFYASPDNAIFISLIYWRFLLPLSSPF